MAFLPWKRPLACFLFWLESSIAKGALGCNVVSCLRNQPLCTMDFDCQWLDATPYRVLLQCSHHAHGSQKFFDVLFNPVAQAKFVHTISAGYVTGSVFVLAISAFTYCARSLCRFSQTLDDCRRRLWFSVCTL